MALLLIQAKEDYEREQRRKERRIESGESSWMLPSLSERLTLENDNKDKVTCMILLNKNVYTRNNTFMMIPMDCREQD